MICWSFQDGYKTAWAVLGEVSTIFGDLSLRHYIKNSRGSYNHDDMKGGDAMLNIFPGGGFSGVTRSLLCPLIISSTLEWPSLYYGPFKLFCLHSPACPPLCLQGLGWSHAFVPMPHSPTPDLCPGTCFIYFYFHSAGDKSHSLRFRQALFHWASFQLFVYCKYLILRALYGVG